MEHDEIFAALYERLRLTPANRVSARELFDAGVAAERERCAKVCETLNHGAFGSPSFLEGVRTGSIGCANAIRKGETP
jgi:hypothetical protein